MPTTFTTRAVTVVVKVALRPVVPVPAYLLVVDVVLSAVLLPMPNPARAPKKLGLLSLLLPARLVVTSALLMALVLSLIFRVTRSFTR